MSEPLLNVMKVMLLAGLYLFFVRVLWSVYSELRDPRTRVSGRSGDAARRSPGHGADPNHPANQPTVRRSRRAATALTPNPQPVAVTVGQLVAVEPGAIAGRSWALGNDTTLGRDPSCGIQIDDTYVSGVHARIFVANDVFHIEDLDSRNGTVLNGEAVTATTALEPGDRIRFGATVLEFS